MIVLTLALGVGVNVAALSLLEQILLRPLDVHEPDRLVNVTAPGPIYGFASSTQAGATDSALQLSDVPRSRARAGRVLGTSGASAVRREHRGERRRRPSPHGHAGLRSYFPVLRGLLFGVAPVDVSALVVATGALVLVALTAAYLPLRRALAVEPSVVRRDE